MDTVDEKPRQFSLDTLAAVWSRRKWLAILAFVALLAGGVSLSAFLPNIYRSAATVLADRQEVPDFFGRATVASLIGTRLSTISQEGPSRPPLGALIKH